MKKDCNNEGKSGSKYSEEAHGRARIRMKMNEREDSLKRGSRAVLGTTGIEANPTANRSSPFCWRSSIF